VLQKAIVAKKLGMTQVFSDNGERLPVTVLQAGPCVVVQKKTVEKDGYSAVQVGFGDIKAKLVNKPAKGHFDKADLVARKVLKELQLENADSLNVGDEIKADTFAAGDRVDVSGMSKGKGYEGPITRWGQHRGPMAHGSKYHRAVGSMGSGTTPGRVKKGKHMAGHMGHVNCTIQNLTVVQADTEKNLLLIKGPVPGAKGTIVLVKNTVKA
jgi:large subunit ribosomal protein L3